MKKIKLNHVLVFLLFPLIALQIFIIFRSKSNATLKGEMDAIMLQNTILYNSFMSSMVYDGKSINNYQVSIKSGEPFLLFDHIHSDVLIVYVPPSNDVCTSCIDYAVNAVKDFFSDFSSNERIILFTNANNYTLKSRMYNKQIYRSVSDSIPHNLKGINQPVYIMVNPDRKMNMFFSPNSLMPDLTTRYLKVIKEKYFDETYYADNE